MIRRVMRAGGPTPVAPHPAPRSRRVLTRVLPGGVMVAAALALPELSVGAGDLDGGEGRSEPPEPAARPEQAGGKRAPETARPANPKLAGVRYAPIIDLGEKPVRAIAAAPHRAALSASAISAIPRELAEPEPVAALEVKAAPVAPVVPALAAPPAAAPRSVPPSLLEPASAPVEALAPRFAPVPQIAAAAVALPAAAPAEIETPATPASAPDVAAAATIPFATFLPEEREALRAPSGAAPAAPLAAVAAPDPAPRAPAALAATPAPVPVVAAVVPSAGRGAVAQLTSETIAAARPAAAPAPAAAPTPAPASPPAPLAAKPALPVTAAAPGARAPIAPTATLAPAPVAAKPAAAPAPASAPARAAIVPRPAPALAAPVSAEQARLGQFDFRAQLLTRIDGRTAGAVDFQQTPAGLKVRLGSVAEVLADRLPPAELARIRNSAAGNTWLSLPELQAQGVPISYDPVYDEFNIGQRDTRPKAASKVHIEQIGDALRRQEALAPVPPAPRPR